MDLAFLSFQLPLALWSGEAFRAHALKYPRVGLGMIVDGAALPEKKLLQELAVAHTEIVATRRQSGGKDDATDIKLVLTGDALAGFLATGRSEHLEHVLTYTPRPIYEAVQLDFPDEQVEVNLPEFFKGLNRLVESKMPVIFRLGAGNRNVFDAVMLESENFPGIPLFPITAPTDPNPAPYPGRPNGYEIDMATWSDRDTRGRLIGLSALGTPSPIEYWIELRYSGPWAVVDWTTMVEQNHDRALRFFHEGV